MKERKNKLRDIIKLIFINNQKEKHNNMIDDEQHITTQQKKEWEYWYFALYSLVPEKQFLELANMFGGLDAVKNSKESIVALSKFFDVEPQLIIKRINLIEQELNEFSDNEKQLEKTIR